MLDKESVFEFLETEIGLDVSGLDSSSPLFSTGTVDSFSLVSLMLFLEREGGFRISPADVTLDNLDSVDRMIGFAQRMAA